MTAQEAIEHLRTSFASGRAASGYTIVGTVRGSAREVVDSVMSYLFCVSENAPCGDCRGCVGAREHTHADLMWIEPQKTSRIISVDQVRELRARMLQTSFAGGWKICVLVAADRFSESASNAFLKILEEPPDRTVFFLLTERPQFLLPTISSRCQRVLVSGESETIPDDWASILVGAMTSLRSSDAVAAFASADRVVALLKEIKEESADEEKEVVSEEATNEEKETTKARINSRYREKRQGVMTFILMWYRDVLMSYCGAVSEVLHNRDHIEVIQEHATNLAYREVIHNVSVVEEMNRKLEANLPEYVVFGHGFKQLR